MTKTKKIAKLFSIDGEENLKTNNKKGEQMETNKGRFIVREKGLERTAINFLAGREVEPFDFLIKKGEINVMVCSDNGSNIVHKIPLNVFIEHPPINEFLPPEKLALFKEQAKPKKQRLFF